MTSSFVPKARYIITPFATSPGKVIKGFGFADEKNIRYRREMEDGHLILDGLGKNKNLTLACIFDGHGGQDTVRYLEKNFQRVFERNLQKGGPMGDILTNTFAEIDNEMKRFQSSGATAVVIVIVKEGAKQTIHSANCGDARAVLVKRNGTGVRLSKDHKLTLPEERERITNAGGFISMGRVNAVLAVSRAFGDHYVKNLVISTPFLSATDLDADDVFVILGCDGVWDVIGDNEAAVCALKARSAQEAAAALKDLALKNGTTDNVSAMVIQL